MLVYQKKGQFFFVATLIIITIIFSLTNIYTTIEVYKDDLNYKFLAQGIKQESAQIINNGYYNDQSFEEINLNVINFVKEYSKNYPLYNITIITGTSSDSSTFKDTSFSKGNIYTSEYILTVLNNNITLDLNSLKFNFNMTKGFNFNVIVIEKNEKGKFIASA